MILSTFITLSFVTFVCGTAPDFRAHDLKRLVHLRNKVDRLQLQQKTDRMKLEVLQKSVENLLASQNHVQSVQREGDFSHALTRGASLSDPGVVGMVGSLSGRSEKPESNGSNIVSNTAPERSVQDDLRRDIMSMREEVSALKSSHALLAAACQRHEATPAETPPSKSSLTSQFSSEIPHSFKKEPAAETYTSSSDENRHKEIRWIEENWKRLQDLQEDLEEKCNVTVAMHVQQEVESRLSGLDESVSVLQKGLSRTSARVAVADEKISALSSDERDTKEALQKANTKLADVHNEVASLREDFNEVLFALPDGALSSGFLSQNSGNASGSSALSSFSKLQRSSVELLEALDNLQSRHEEDQTRVGKELAELEYNVSKATQDIHEAIDLLRSNSDRESHHEVDMNAITDHVRMLKDSFGLISLYQDDIAYRLGKLELNRLTIPSDIEKSSEEDLSWHSAGRNLDGVVSLLNPRTKTVARTKLESKTKRRRHRNKRKNKFRT